MIRITLQKLTRTITSHSVVTLLWTLSFCLTTATAAEKPPTYEDHVLPVFREKCCSCHNADRKAGGLDLTSYQQMIAGGNSGDVVAGGDPDGSYLWQVVSHESEPTMPPDADRIPDAMLNVVKEWILGGIIERDGAKPVAQKAGASLALDSGALVKPSGPPVMPPRLSLEPRFSGLRPTTIRALDASPHGDVVAVGSSQQVLLFQPRTCECIGVLPFPEGECTNIRFSRSAKLLLAGGGVAAKSGRVVIWDVASAQRVMELGDEYDEVLAADISADQRLVALGGAAKVVRLLQTVDGSVESEITKHTDWITSVAFSPDSVLLATGDRAGNLFLWESFGARHWGDLKGQKAGVTAIDWRADGIVLATTSEDGTIHLWEADTAKKIKSWSAHGGGATDVRWLSDGRLVSTGRDHKVKVWRSDGSLESELGTLSDIGTKVAITSGKPLAIAGDWSGQISVYDVTKPSKVGGINSNQMPLSRRVNLAEKATAVAEKAAEDIRLAKMKAAKVEANFVSQLSAANKSLGVAGSEQKSRNVELEATAVRVKAAEDQLGITKLKAKKAQEIVRSLEEIKEQASGNPEKEVANEIFTAANKTLVDTNTSVGLAEQGLQESQAEHAAVLKEKQVAVKNLADLTSRASQLNDQVEKAVASRKSIDEKLMAAVKKYQSSQENLKKWQDELVFSQAATSKSE